MPTQKQLKTTQKVGGKAPTSSAKAPAKTQGGKAPTSSAKSPAKTQGGKAPVPQAKAPAKIQGGKAPTSSAKTPAKTRGGKAPASQAKTQGGKGKAPASQAKTQGGKAPASQAKVRGGYDPDPQCTIENICDDCNSMGRLETLINDIIPIEEYKELSDDKKQDYLKKVYCLKNKVQYTRPGLFSHSGKELKEIIQNLNNLLRDKKTVAAEPIVYQQPESSQQPREAKVCTLEDFSNCNNNISEICVYAPLVLRMLVRQSEEKINRYRYKNAKSDSMLKTLSCLKDFIKKKGNIDIINSLDHELYGKIYFLSRKIEKLPEPPIRTGQVNNHLPPIR